jgi:glycosyltransferase involved in cell wall biosynthesis
MPTYNRPDVLRRAIESLLRQTYPHWKAVVFDDSTRVGARDVVQSADDSRITYKKNQNRMGAAGNIDQCFSPQAMFSGHYGCMLEDDNFLLPDFLAELIRSITKTDSQLILANQIINDEGSGLQGQDATTRGNWFFDGMVSPLDLRASLLLMEGISNGGLVWRLENKIDLRVGPTVKEAGLQEACRSLLVRTPLLFISQALAVWTSVPQPDSARAQETYRLFGRGMQSIRSFVLRCHGRTVVDLARPIAQKRGLNSRLVETLSYSGYPHLAGDLVRGRTSTACRAVVKGLAIRLVQNDPCDSFIQSLADAGALPASASSQSR